METNNEQLNIQERLFQDIDNSEYGQLLVQRTRFGNFKPDFVDTEMWCNLLGPDVNNLYHMDYTKHLAEDFCDLGNVDPDTKDLLLTVAITHDIGEAIIGDIALPDKTEADEQQEKLAYRKIATELWGEAGNELTDRVWRVLNKEDAETGDMFRAIEYVGYCSTAKRALLAAESLAHGFIDIGLPRDQKETVMGGLLALHKAVEVNNYPVLKGYIQKYPQIAPLYWSER